MGTIFVKTMTEMKVQNRLWWQRVGVAQTRALIEMAAINQIKSKEIAEQVKFTGTLMSMIQTNSINKSKVQVIASAPHAYAIEKGEPGVRGYVSFTEEPGLENWVKNKLTTFDPDKAAYFLSKQAVKIGTKGFPFGYPNGIKFMELGYKQALVNANIILGNELMKLGGV